MKRRKKVSGEKIFSVIISFAIILTLAIGVFSVIKNSKQNSNNPENIVDLNETKANNLSLNNNPAGLKQLQSIANEAEEKTGAVTTEAATKATQKAVEAPSAAAKYSFSENDTLKWPVKGDVVLKYSMDTTVYFKTLGQYKTNPAVVIASKVGTNVVAAASGVVLSVSTNDETGTTVVVNIGNGYTATYGQLDNVTLKQGSTIVAGDKIGTVANPSKYYTSEGPNIYFKLTKNGDINGVDVKNLVDPTPLFAE